ncbi:hypothetical protein D9M69_718110 [compost metagenome]
MVAVIVELSPQHRSAIAKRVGASAEPSNGLSKACALSRSSTPVLPVALKLAAARIRIEALTSNAKVRAMVESSVAKRIASRFSGRV